MRRQKGRFDMFLQVCNAGPASFCQKQVYCFGKGMRAYTFVIHKGVDQCTSMDLQAKFKLVVSLRGKTCFSGMLFSYGNPCHTPKPPNWTRALNSVPAACWHRAAQQASGHPRSWNIVMEEQARIGPMRILLSLNCGGVATVGYLPRFVANVRARA